jgi:hypothetical protein
VGSPGPEIGNSPLGVRLPIGRAVLLISAADVWRRGGVLYHRAETSLSRLRGYQYIFSSSWHTRAITRPSRRNRGVRLVREPDLCLPKSGRDPGGSVENHVDAARAETDIDSDLIPYWITKARSKSNGAFPSCHSARKSLIRMAQAKPDRLSTGLRSSSPRGPVIVSSQSLPRTEMAAENLAELQISLEP